MIYNYDGSLVMAVAIKEKIPSTNNQITNNIQIRNSNDPNTMNINSELRSLRLIREIISLLQSFGH